MTNEIISTLRKIPKEILSGEKDSAWTKAVKQALGKLGVQKGYKICASGIEYENEWLYDLVWYKEDNDNFLSSVPLVMESEWDKSFKAIKYDFEKLLLSKSKYKIMIFQATEPKQNTYFQLLEEGIEKFHADNVSETYVLACFDEIPYEFKFKVIQKPDRFRDPIGATSPP